jgi:hypothetical protein
MTAILHILAHVTESDAANPRFMIVANDPIFAGKALKTYFEAGCASLEKLSVEEQGDDAITTKRIESIVNQNNVDKAVLEDRIKILEGQIQFERDRCDKVMDVKCKQNSSHIRGLEGEQMVFEVLNDALKYNADYRIENHSKVFHEGDIHVVNTRKKLRTVIEVKNKQAIDTEDVNKVYKDIEHLKVKYNGESIGYVFLSLVDKLRIPTKGFGCIEFVDKLPVIWTSMDVVNEGYATLRSIVMDRVNIIEGLATKPISVDPDEKDEAVCELEEENNVLKVMAQMHEVELDKAYKTFMKMERDAKAGKTSIAAYLRYIRKENVSSKAETVGPEVTKQELFSWCDPDWVKSGR